MVKAVASGVLILGATVIGSEQLGFSSKLTSDKKKDLVGKYMNRCKEFKILYSMTNNAWSRLVEHHKHNKIKMCSIPVTEYEIESLNEDYESILKNKIKVINIAKSIGGDIVLTSASLIEVLDLIDDYHKKYSCVYDKILAYEEGLGAKI